MLRLAALATLSIASAQSAPPGPDFVMDQIEAAVEMPSGASPLGRYRRYYAWDERGPGMVRGVYLSGEPAGRLWVAPGEVPLTLDGGCGVVELSYDHREGRVTRIACNGEA